MTGEKGPSVAVSESDYHERAKAFIDAIIALNEKYGMGGSPSDETYERAVQGSASVAKAASRGSRETRPR